MNKMTSIYMLFKEYPDPNGRGKSNAFIQDSVDYLLHPEALMQDWTDLFDVLSYFDYEKANRYYDADNLEGLLNVARNFQEEYPMVVDTIRSEMQSVGLTDWRNSETAKTEAFDFQGIDVTSHLLGEMAQMS